MDVRLFFCKTKLWINRQGGIENGMKRARVKLYGARYLCTDYRLQSTGVPRSPRHSRRGRDRWLEVPDSGNLREFPRRLWTLPVILSWQRDSQSSSRYPKCSPPRRQASTLSQGCHGMGSSISHSRSTTLSDGTDWVQLSNLP